MRFPCFSVLPGSAEAQVIWGGIVICLLIAYFIGNISAQKYQNPLRCLKVIASQRWDVFLRHGVLLVRCLSVCLSVLSVTLVYCGQTVAWMKMKLGMQIVLGRGQIVLDRAPAPPPLIWLCGPAVEHRSLAGVLSLSCARFVADGWPLMWVSHPL